MLHRTGFALALCLSLAQAPSARAEEDWEREVRAAEANHLAAFKSGDAAAIRALLADDFLVNNPRYEVADKDELMAMVEKGMLKATTFSQTIERIRRYGDLVFVMGGDTVVFAPPAPNAGPEIHRRFTDVWRRDGGQWVMVARHANPICR
jgi:ketosteroid isomerase-like protein